MNDIPSGEQQFGKKRSSRKATIVALALLVTLFLSIKELSGCIGHGPGDPELTKNIHLELVDWHIVGLWVMNCPCGWVRVANYNKVPVKNVRVRFKTFGYNGEQLNESTYILSGATPADGTVKAGGVKNFIEQYMGLVDLESDMLSVELVSVDRAD